ncbi:peptidoglycan-binding domain-containing protein [Streptomyces ochraceiscleroticus]|uniref:Peptidoglycan-binding protein n=1 Tax=Streptomyces ochraceiscleroticus TaxID=47761 RepID=A0ABW1MEN2_9ACTN|nr:peptidoglycan-binding domain-containing protein [Streptomyces ochraceiscleroticus]
MHIRPYVSLPDAPDPDDHPDMNRRPRAFTVRAYSPPAFPPPSYVRVERPPYAPPPYTARGEEPVPEPYQPVPEPYQPYTGEAPALYSAGLPGPRRAGLPVAGPVAFMDPPPETAPTAATAPPAPRRRGRPALLAGLMVTAAAGSVCAALFGGELRPADGTGQALPDLGSRSSADLPTEEAREAAEAAQAEEAAEAAQPRPTAPAPASRSAARLPGPRTVSAGVLAEGASGPEVVELQRRLAQLALYAGAADGRYDAGVTASVARYQRTYGETTDPYGVYGPATRASLEFLTRP